MIFREVQIVNIIENAFNPCQANIPFLYPLKMSENLLEKC